MRISNIIASKPPIVIKLVVRGLFFFEILIPLPIPTGMVATTPIHPINGGAISYIIRRIENARVPIDQQTIAYANL